jgi:hypothetical protein
MIDDEKDFLVVRELLSHIAIRMFAEQGRGMIAGPFEESETRSDEEVVSSGNWVYVPRGRCGSISKTHKRWLQLPSYSR